MKLLALIVTLISVSYAFKDRCRGNYVRQLHDECMSANGGDRVVIEDLLQFKPAQDTNGKCFRHCIMRKCDYYGSDGKLKPDVPKRLAWLLHSGKESNKKPIEAAALKCMYSSTYGDSDCDKSENFLRCLVQQSPVKLTIFNEFD